MVTIETPTMLDVALDALHHGFAVVPPAEDGSKRPDGQWKAYQQRLPTPDEVTAWYASGRTGIGIVTGAVSGNLEMLEFEGRALDENIHEEFATLAAAAGLTNLVDRINAGYCETTPAGGLHLLYRVTDGTIAGNTKLARRAATAAELAVEPADKVKVLIETRGEGGYVIVAPSHGAVHPSGHEWVLLNGGFHEVVSITAAERDQLHAIARALDDMPAPAPAVAPAPSAVAYHDAGGSRPGDDYNADPGTPQRTLELLERHGWTEVFRRPHDSHTDVHLRRPGKNDGTSAVLHMDAGTFVNFSSSVADFDQEVGYTPFHLLTVLEHHGDHQHAARALRPAPAPGSAPFPIADATYAPLPAATTSSTASTAGGLHLPDELWDARPILDHIRTAARARLVAPDAVLGAVLTRIAACTPHAVEIPGVIGTPMGLTTYVGIVGPPEAGKSAASGVAAELLPAPSHVLDRLPIGSGEGMVEILFDLVTEEGEGGKKTKVKRQTRHAAIFHIDEGAVLSDLANRQGTTLLPTLRTAFTHGTLGNANASTERKRIVDGKSYVYGITLGIQPELAGPLLADTAAGTPQRFIWLMATDPQAAPGVAWPGVLPWTSPDGGNLDAIAIVRDRQKRYQLELADSIRDQIVADRMAVMHGTRRSSSDAHQMLVRLKTAALLALLDRRLEVDDDDWHLAGLVLATSHAVRRSVESTLAVVELGKEQAGLDRHARRELHVETTKEARALTSAARSVANIVAKHAADVEHADPAGCAKRCVHAAMNSKMRSLVTVDDAILEALDRGFVKRSADRLVPGDARPA